MKTKNVLLVCSAVLLVGCGGGSSPSESNTPTNNATPPSATPPPVVENPTVAPVVDGSLTSIGIYFIYTPTVQSAYNVGAKIDHYIAFTNAVNQKSGIALEYYSVGSHQDDSQEYLIAGEAFAESLNRITPDTNPKIDSLAKSLQADVVVGFRMSEKSSGIVECGVSWIGGLLGEGMYSGISASIVDPECSSVTLAHELGHVHGLEHSEFQGDSGGIYPYSRGYGVQNDFSTVMTYDFVFNATIVPIYSTPNLLCGTSEVPCGVSEGDAHQADATKSIINTKNFVASFR